MKDNGHHDSARHSCYLPMEHKSLFFRLHHLPSVGSGPMNMVCLSPDGVVLLSGGKHLVFTGMHLLELMSRSLRYRWLFEGLGCLFWKSQAITATYRTYSRNLLDPYQRSPIGACGSVGWLCLTLSCSGGEALQV